MSDSDSPSPHSDAFARWIEQFLQATLDRFPVDASFLGATGRDHAYPDYSSEANADWSARTGELIRALDAIPTTGLTEAQLYDRILARGTLQVWNWEGGAPYWEAGNPAHHISEAIGGVVALLYGGERPSVEQQNAATARMQAIPVVLITARRRVRSAPLVWTELAIRQADAGARFFGVRVPQLVDAWGIRYPELLSAASGAAAAFGEHATWLRMVLASSRSEVPPAGEDAFTLLLRHGHVLPASQTPGWWFDYAHAELIEATAELQQAAREIDWRATPRTLLQRVAEEHPSADGYEAAFPAAWKRCRAIAVDAGLLTWPDIPMQFRGLPAADAELWQALGFPVVRGPLPMASELDAWSTYSALDQSWPVEDQDRLLRQMNDARILLEVAVRNAGLGFFVQSAAARSAPTRIGRIAGTPGATRRLFFCGNAVADGWACYAAELMEEVGALTPLQRLAEAQRRLRVAANAVADIGMHTGELSLGRVARMFRDEAGMTATRAMEQAVWNSMHPGAGMAELVGTAGIDELRRAMEDRAGAGFDLRSFHDEFLSHGCVPVTLIAASMLAREAGEAQRSTPPRVEESC